MTIDELLRAFINFPEKRTAILKELIPYLAAPSELEQAILRLKQEEVLSEPKLLLDEFRTQPVFDEHMLDELQTLLTHLKGIYHLLGNKNYKSKIQSIDKYMESLQDSMKAYSFELIKDELVPPFNLGFFSKSNRTLFREFSEKYGPVRCFLTSDFIEAGVGIELG